MTMMMTIEQQLARLARDINGVHPGPRGAVENATANFTARATRLEDAERRVQPVARLIATQLREAHDDAPQVEGGEDQVVLALEMIMVRLLAIRAAAGNRRRRRA